MKLESSREHHWWPVALQKHWADRSGYVSRISPDGSIERKKAKNRGFGKKAHGHRFLKGTDWEHNFEPIFGPTDNSIHGLIGDLKKLRPPGYKLTEFIRLALLLFRDNRGAQDFCRFYEVDVPFRRRLLELIFSLLARAPSNRYRFEELPPSLGLPRVEDIGTLNIFNSLRVGLSACRNNSISNQAFVLIHSPLYEFISGDGFLDSISGHLVTGTLRGRALVPLTPNLCVYVCSPMHRRTNANLAAITAAHWHVEAANEAIQIYSRDQLFYRSREPKLSDAFRRKAFLQYTHHSNSLTAFLDDLFHPDSRF